MLTPINKPPYWKDYYITLIKSRLIPGEIGMINNVLTHVDVPVNKKIFSVECIEALCLFLQHGGCVNIVPTFSFPE